MSKRPSGSFTVSPATGDIIGQEDMADQNLVMENTLPEDDAPNMDVSAKYGTASTSTLGYDSFAGDDSNNGESIYGLNDENDLEKAEQAPKNDDSKVTSKSTGLDSRISGDSKKSSVSWAKEDENFYPDIFANSSREFGADDDDEDSKISRPSEGVESVEMAEQQVNYLKRKRVFISSAASLLAFNNGFLNGATLSGLASPGSKLPALTVTGLTASLSLNGLFLSQAMWEEYGIHLGIILSYFLGCFIAGYTTPNPKPYRLEPTYGPTFILGGIFLLIGGFIASFLEEYGAVAYWFSAAASGIQNGIASRYSANLIRCTVTGTTTDIALIMAQMVRGVDANVDNGIVLALITFNFWFGGAVSFFAAQRFMKYTLLANAVMFWVIGLGIIFFLVSELGLSVNAAVSGNWKWRKTMQSLRKSTKTTSLSLVDMFDLIDAKKNGEVTPEELLDALLNAGVKTNLRTVRVLVSYADANNNGTIDRDEWATIVEQVMAGSSFASSSVANRISKTAHKIREESSHIRKDI